MLNYQDNNPTQQHSIDIAEVKLANAKLWQAQSQQLYTTLSQAIAGFKSRAGQQQIVELCANNSAQHGQLVVEAGTGVGKTFGYILGHLPAILQNEQRLLISTNTITLQNQLMEKDLPQLLAILAPELTYTIAKSGSRYLCPAKVRSLLTKTEKNTDADSTDDMFDSASPVNMSSAQLQYLKEVYTLFTEGNFAGDLDQLQVANAPQYQKLLNRDQQRCPGQRGCSDGKQCPFYLQREKISKSDIVVTNHAFLVNVLMHDSNAFGDLTNTMLVLDEAHHLPKVIRDVNQAELDLSQAAEIADQFDKLEKASNKLIKTQPALFDDINKFTTSIQRLKPAITDFCEQLQQLNEHMSLNFMAYRGKKQNSFDDIEQWLMSYAPMPISFVTPLLNLYQSCATARTYVEQLNGQFRQQLDNKDIPQAAENACNRWLQSSANLLAMVAQAHHCLDYYYQFTNQQTEDQRLDVGIARWVKNDAATDKITLLANVIDVSQHFQLRIAQAFKSQVLTSATLKTLGSFNHINRQLGINSETSIHADIPSDFNYRHAFLSWAPSNAPEPNNEHFIGYLTQQIMELTQRHSAILVIFTAHNMLESTFNLMPTALKQQILCQDKRSKSELIQEHKRRIDAGQTSILFGVDSLSEGLDLQGKYLTGVVIAKLPFPSLSEPLINYEKITLDARGINSFAQMMVPECSRKLIQSVGRLIRSEQDWGEVFIADRRIQPRPFSNYYGNILLNALPIFQQGVR